MKAVEGIGAAINRVEGRLKVTGRAKYASEFPVAGKLYGQGINSTIARGRIVAVDTREALAQPGVVAVLTHENAMQLAEPIGPEGRLSTDSQMPVLQGPEVHYYGQYVGLVVAETLEQAQYACRLVKYEYATEEPAVNFDDQDAAFRMNERMDYRRGDVQQGLQEADEVVEATYITPMEHHHPMELHAVIASWEGDQVEVYASQQMIEDSVVSIAKTFGLEEENVRVQAPFIGGGFGAKLNTERHVTLALMAAKQTGRPVQVTVTRTQMFTNTSFRQRNVQALKVGATAEGQLTALVHNTLSHTSTYESYQEQCGTPTRMLYASPNAEVQHRLVRLNVQTPFAMRAPGEAPGSFALESAIDELAWKLRMDPIELRIKNDTQTDPSNGKPFSSRLLTECLRIGAEKFGWQDRPRQPRSRQEGNWLVGYGVSAAARAAPYQACSARVVLKAQNGEVHATVQTGATDIGTGTYTILAQTAAEELQIPVERITVELGDTRFPDSPGSGGSWGAASFSNGVRVACEQLKQELRARAGIAEGEEASAARLLLDNDLATYAATGRAERPERAQDYSIYSFGANFAEVRVNKDTGMWHIQRMVSVGSAGTILNPKTAYGQVVGGIVMGAGMAIAEKTDLEPRYGNFITRSLADYHVPVNLDMAKVDVVFLPEKDEVANKMGIKGIGELGITSVAGAITNALFNATGKRFRELPVTPEKVLLTPLVEGVV